MNGKPCPVPTNSDEQLRNQVGSVNKDQANGNHSNPDGRKINVEDLKNGSDCLVDATDVPEDGPIR